MPGCSRRRTRFPGWARERTGGRCRLAAARGPGKLPGVTSTRLLRPRRVLLLAGLLLLVLAPLALGTRYASEQACEAARAQLPGLLGADVAIGACELAPFSGGVVLRQLEVRRRDAAPGAPPLFAAEEAAVSGASLRPSVRALELSSLRLVRPRMVVDLRAPRPTHARAPGCPLEPLKRLEVGRLAVRDGEVELLLPAERAVRVGGLQLSAEQRGGAADFELSARDAQVSPGGGAAALPLSRLLLRGTFSPRDERVEFRRAEVGMDAALLSWTGAVETLCTPELALEAQLYLPLAAAARLAPLPAPVAGHAWARVSLSGPAEDPRAVVDVTATDVRLGHFVPGDFRVHARVADGRAEVDPVTVPVGEGRVLARGTLVLEEGLPFRGAAEVEGAGFGRLLERAGLAGSWVDFQAAARLQFSGRARPFELSGEGELQGERFLLAARPWNSLATAGRDILAFPRGEAGFGFRVTPERTDLARVSIRTGQGNVRGDAVIHHGARQGLEVRGAASELDFTALGHLAGIAWGGKGGGEFEVEGPWGGIRAEALLHLRDFSYWRFALGTVDGRLTWGNHVLGLREVRGQKGQSPYTGEGELSWRPGGLLARGTLGLERGRAEDVADMTAPLSQTLASLLVGSLEGGASLHVEVAGPGDRLGGTVRLGLRDATYDGRRLGTGELRFTLFDGEGYRLEPSSLSGPMGTLRAEGQSLYDGPLDYRFALEDGLLEEVLAEPGGKVHGKLTVSGKWEGDTTTPVMTAWITSPALEVAGRALGAMHLEARMAGR